MLDVALELKLGIANRRQRLFTEEEYLLLEEAAEEKSEYFRGRIYAMAGGTPEHGAICVRVIVTLDNAIRDKPCTVYNSDVRIKIEVSGLNTYPDGSVVCNKTQLHTYKNTSSILNPTLIVEVLSPSTEKYDRGDKFENYKLIPSLTDYLLVSQDRAKVEHFVRQKSGDWICTVSEGLEGVVSIDSLKCALPLSEIYLKVDL